jgi:Protein of unknown function (DUF2961)
MSPPDPRASSSARLVLLACGLAAAAAAPTSFSCAASTVTLKAGDAPLEVCVVNSTTGSAAVTVQWYTASNIKSPDGTGGEAVQISLYLDGETTPSLQFYPYEFAGFPSLEAHLATPASNTWSAALFGRYSASSWNSNIQIPFSRSLRVTLQYTPPSGSATIYYQAHGLDGVQPALGLVPLPPSARLVLQRNRLSLPALAYLPVVDFPAGTSGVVAGIAIAFVAPNLNTLEGCFHFYPTAATPYPGQLHSTGTEDEFISSYYFDLGVFQGRSAGIFYKQDGGGKNSSTSMYRTYQDDPMLFSDGGRFVWRNGDTVDANGVKCMLETGGSTAGSPGTADVQALSYTYVW